MTGRPVMYSAELLWKMGSMGARSDPCRYGSYLVDPHSSHPERVMFLTGKSDKESIMKVLALKPVGYLLKTVDKKELNENIGKYFATHNA